jgi:hypothetical protein
MGINIAGNNQPAFDPNLRVAAYQLDGSGTPLPPATTADPNIRWMIRGISISTDDAASNVTLYSVDAAGSRTQVRQWRVSPSTPVVNDGPFTTEYGSFFRLYSDDGRPDEDAYFPITEVSYDPLPISKDPRTLG